MSAAKYNDKLMALNQKQLDEDVTRSDIRRQRRQVLEAVLDDRENYSYKGKDGKPRSMVMGLILFSVVGVVAASYLLYLLSIE
ncbi:hypothetical protein [Hahella ganghwensis]|uniref:hypothetical protein n=1 Tax=Hahella ganghwensis TaxID=286420 RepID=UPI0003660AB5|nr:hypothetical protein [Hahella ganghwensis]